MVGARKGRRCHAFQTLYDLAFLHWLVSFGIVADAHHLHDCTCCHSIEYPRLFCEPVFCEFAAFYPGSVCLPYGYQLGRGDRLAWVCPTLVAVSTARASNSKPGAWSHLGALAHSSLYQSSGGDDALPTLYCTYCRPFTHLHSSLQ